MAKPFKKIAELDPNTLMIVDSLNLGFRWKHSGAVEFTQEYIKTVESLRTSYKAKYVVIACDSGSSAYRKALFPEYKGNREELKANQTPEEELAFKIFFEEFNRTIETYTEVFDYPVFRFHKTEADDIAAYIVKIRHKFPVIKQIVLISSDRDWDLLIDLDVMRFSYVTRKETTLDNWNEHYECEPEHYISVKCLQGDSGDNIPGVSKIGPKTATKLVKQYGSTYDIIANMPIPGKYVYINNLNAFGKEALERNYKLMDLLEFCDEAIGTDNCILIEETMKEYIENA